MMNRDIHRNCRTLTPKGFARVIVLAIEEVYTKEAGEKILAQMLDVFEGAEMPLHMNDKPNASKWCESLAHELYAHQTKS